MFDHMLETRKGGIERERMMSFGASLLIEAVAISVLIGASFLVVEQVSDPDSIIAFTLTAAPPPPRRPPAASSGRRQQAEADRRQAGHSDGARPADRGAEGDPADGRGWRWRGRGRRGGVEGGVPGGVPGGVVGGVVGGVLGGVLGGPTWGCGPDPSRETSRRRSSSPRPPGVPGGGAARQDHRQGHLAGDHQRAGLGRGVEVLRSNPMLDQAAIDAVKKWKYKPATLNGRPVKVYFTVVVNFSLT